MLSKIVRSSFTTFTFTAVQFSYYILTFEINANSHNILKILSLRSMFIFNAVVIILRLDGLLSPQINNNFILIK